MDSRLLLNEKNLKGPDRDIIMLAAPEMANLSNWIIAFVAAGGLAAALSTASGLLLVISSSVANDLYYRTLHPKASEKNQLFVGRCAIAISVIIAGYFGLNPPRLCRSGGRLCFRSRIGELFPSDSPRHF